MPIFALTKQLILLAIIATQSCCTDSVQSNDFCQRRLDSAHVLTAQAQDLIGKNNAIIERCEGLANTTFKYESSVINKGPIITLIAQAQTEPSFKLETAQDATVPPATPEAKPEFTDLLSAYQDARTAYLKHRQDYDLHVKEFHHQAQQDSRQPAPLTVPNEPPLQLQAEDACAELLRFEQQLKISEEELISLIQALQNQKDKLPKDTFFQRWLTTQSMAVEFQNRALQFNHAVVQKDKEVSTQLHDATQAAVLSGDYIQSRKVFAETQRKTSLENEEAHRAQIHSSLASEFLININSLNPDLPNGGVTPNITSDQLLRESTTLESEYADLQNKYAAMQNANPARKRKK